MLRFPLSLFWGKLYRKGPKNAKIQLIIQHAKSSATFSHIHMYILIVNMFWSWCIDLELRYKFCIQVSIQENLDQENLNSSLCIHDARNFDEYTQVLTGDTTNKMAFLGGEEGAALCIALLCTIVLQRRLSSKKRSTWARKWLRRQWWDVFLWNLLDLQSFH